MTLDTQTATLVAAAVAAIASLSNTIITSWRQSRLEERRWRRARQDELDKWQQQRQDSADVALRTAIATLGQQLSACVQAICWFTWKAAYAPEQVTSAEFEKYEAEIKVLLPTLVSARFMVAALDRSAGDEVKEAVETVYALDAEVTVACNRLAESREEALDVLFRCYGRAEAFLDTLHDRFAPLFSRITASSTALSPTR